MKKVFFLVTIIAVMVTCMVACSNNSKSEQEGVDIPMDVTITVSPTEEEVVDVPKLPNLSREFIETALQFINEYQKSPSKKLENLAAEVIYMSAGYSNELYNNYLTPYVLKEHGEVMQYHFGYQAERIYTVSVYIHNYRYGGYVGGMVFNGQAPLYNYQHDKIILAAAILKEEYPDNISLAQARIAAYALTRMDKEKALSCLRENSEGEFYYDFTFENETFAGFVKETLAFLCKE